jgi:hypothetical protein
MATASVHLVDSFSWLDTFDYEQDVAVVIRRAIAARQPMDRRLDQRRDARYPYPYPLTLLPIDSAMTADHQGLIPAIGKQLTLRGIDFYTTRPLAAKEVVCQFQAGNPASAIVLELNWCRHNAQGWFENGGRFLRAWRGAST